MSSRCAAKLTVALLVIAFGLGRALAEPADVPPNEPAPMPAAAPKHPVSRSENSLCLLIESAARANDLSYEFFARVIWQESRFRSDAVGPPTRSGGRAQGIAQFMPGTAAERRLLDPFDPVQALPKSAEFLHELSQQFGNLGLAAAAYNAGPNRVREWLAGNGTMPQETRSYVLAITGRTVDEWAAARGQRLVPAPREAPGCAELIALVKSAPNPFVHELEQRVTLAAVKPWGVQLAAGFSKDLALAAYAHAIKGLGSALEGHDPSILSTVLRSRGTHPFYQVRIGTDTRPEADGLCGRVRRAGGACLVLRNGASNG
jgi:soluble lytic murein transglycosylase-like protein